MKRQSGTFNFTPLIILALVATTLLFAGLFVLERAGTFIKTTASDSGGSEVSQYRWKMVTSWPKNFPGLGTGPEDFVKLVNRMSDGRLQIEVFGANEIVPALGVFDAVSSGSVEMGHSGAYYWKGKIPASSFFTSVPFGLNAQEMNAWLHYGGGMELWRELYAPFNIIPFAGGNTGVQMGGWFNREIRSMQDIKGLKMRLPGIAAEVFARAGGTAVNIPGGDIYTSMQTGVIDATEWVGPYNDLAFGLHEVAKYYYYPGWHEPGSNLEFLVNRTAWDSLPPDLQAIVEVATQAVNLSMLEEFTAYNSRALQTLREKYPEIEVRPYPDDVWTELSKIADHYYAEQSAENADFKRVYESMTQFREQAADWLKISEQAYFDMREKTTVDQN